MKKNVTINNTDKIGIMALQICMHVLILILPFGLSIFLCPDTTTEWSAILMFLETSVVLEFINSFIASITKTTIGISRPWSSQTSTSFRLESFGNSAWIELYNVYITRFEVRATMIRASKCVSSKKRAVSAASIRQIDGMKRENQKGPESRRRLKAK